MSFSVNKVTHAYDFAEENLLNMDINELYIILIKVTLQLVLTCFPDHVSILILNPILVGGGQYVNFFKKLKNEKKSESTALLLFINFSYAYFRRFFVIIVPGTVELRTFHRTYLSWAILTTHIIHTFLPH